MKSFVQIVQSVLNESPDSVIYNSKEYTYAEGDLTFFIANVVLRPDIKKGYDDDIDTDLGLCVVSCPTEIPPDKEKEIYLEDPEVKAMTHSNLSSLLNYNQVYTYDKLKSFGIEIHSLKVNADSYFQNLKKMLPRMSFALKGDEHEIGLKYRGRIWRANDEILVSTWQFNKKIAEKYIIPFIKKKYNVSEDKIVIETSTNDEHGKIISAKNVSEVDDKIDSIEKKIISLQQKLHQSAGNEKNKIKEELRQLLAKHNISPEKYGLNDDILKSSQLYAQKVLKGSGSNASLSALKSKTQTSESLVKN